MFGEFLPLSGAGKLRLATEEEDEEEEVDINLEAALPILLLLLLPVLCPSSGGGWRLLRGSLSSLNRGGGIFPRE